MKTIVYVDGFNLYYGAVKGTPYHWLNLGRMCALLLPHDRIHQIKYFTALVNPRQHDLDQRVRQETYLRALATIPNLSVALGYFLTHEGDHAAGRRQGRLCQRHQDRRKRL